MTRGDRAFLLAIMSFLTSMIYLIDNDYVYWIVWLVIALAYSHFGKKLDKEGKQ